jgi:hypothetical protein
VINVESFEITVLDPRTHYEMKENQIEEIQTNIQKIDQLMLQQKRVILENGGSLSDIDISDTSI